jgi:LAO/AO transport system kinase
MSDSIEKIISTALNGDKVSTARLISMVERGDPHAADILKSIYPHSGRAYTIGITGPPGAGKSTLVNRLVRRFCRNDFSVGIIAVDPSSPFSGGALLGDRVRMDMEQTRGDVFFRSMSAGRAMGGLARATKDASRILDASGKQIIIIETVGVGQSELDIAQATDTVVVVMVPESGDTIQTLKAGLMEIADIFVVNKMDRPGSETMAQAIDSMLERTPTRDKWRAPVLETAASLDRGITVLYDEIWRRHRYLKTDSRLETRRKCQLRAELLRSVEAAVTEMVVEEFLNEEKIDHLVESIWLKQADIRGASRRVIDEWIRAVHFKMSGKE